MTAYEQYLNDVRNAKSKGHLGYWVTDIGITWEYFRRGSDIYRANVDAPVFPDGYRCGRSEWASWQWDKGLVTIPLQATL